MARLTNTSGANDNGAPTWHDKRHRDSYESGATDTSDDTTDEDDE